MWPEVSLEGRTRTFQELGVGENGWGEESGRGNGIPSWMACRMGMQEESRRCNRRITKDSDPHGKEFSLHLLG